MPSHAPHVPSPRQLAVEAAGRALGRSGKPATEYRRDRSRFWFLCGYYTGRDTRFGRRRVGEFRQ